MSAEQLKDTTAMPIAGKPPATVQISWVGAHEFEGGRLSGGAAIHMDSSGKTGPSPIDTLLCALAGCTGVDIGDILEKRRTPMSAMSVDVVGERFAGTPGRITKIHLVYHITGADVERVHAERAIELAVTKYCSVRDSLDPNLPVTWKLELNGSYE